MSTSGHLCLLGLAHFFASFRNRNRAFLLPHSNPTPNTPNRHSFTAPQHNSCLAPPEPATTATGPSRRSPGNGSWAGAVMGAAGSRLEKALGEQFPEGERYFGLENFGNTCYCNSVLQVMWLLIPHIGGEGRR